MSINEDVTNSTTKTPPDESGENDETPKNNGDEHIKSDPADFSTTTATSITTPTITSTTIIATNKTELSDPAILAICENPKYRYTKDELLKLRDVPLSLKKPDFLDTNEVSPSIWDPNRWNSDNNRKKTDTPVENSSRTNDLLDHRRRPGDARERLRKDDGIVLCPQRRSFNSGCFVPVTRDTTRTNTNRPHSPLGGKSESSHLTGVRGDIQSNSRRIGSGRILRDTWDFSDKSETDNDYGFRSNSSSSNNGNNNSQQQQQRNNDDLNNRRSFGRDFDKDRRNNTNIISNNSNNNNSSQQQNRFNSERRRLNSNNNNNSGSRDYHNHHHNNHHHHEEPEWFSGGPSSQNDTIELRGFDDNEKLTITTTNNNNNGNKKKMSPSQAKRARDWYKKKHENSSATIPEEKDNNDGDNIEITTKDGGGVTIDDDDNNTKTDNNKLRNSNNDNAEDDDDNNSKKDRQDDKNRMDDQCSIFEDILKADTIPGLPGILTNGVGGDGDGQSRFSKWFSKDNHSSRNDSRRSSIQDDQQSLITQQFLSNILTDNDVITTTSTTATSTSSSTTTKGINIKIHDDSNSYFAPISPAINHNHNNFIQPSLSTQTTPTINIKGINIMEMLQKSKQFDNNLVKPVHMPPGRIVNLADLEAKIRQNSEQQQHQQHKSHHHHQQQQQQQKNDEDMSAFNQLLAQVSGGHIIPANGSLLGLQKQQPSQPPMSLMEMLNHSQQQDEARMAQMMCGPISPSGLHPHMQQQQPPPPSQQHNDLTARYHHLNKLNIMRSSPLMMDLGLQQSRELLNRPEAQAILQGLKIGDITLQHLHQQLANPALQPRHRELLYTILKQQQQQQNGVGNNSTNNSNSGGGSGNSTNLGTSPRVLSPVPPQQSYQQQQQQTPPSQQQLRLSPLQPNAYCVSPIMATSPNTLTVPAMHQRIPSPRELQVHTQNILQRALIKKKLEEQQENYRKRQEIQQQQRGQSPNNQQQSTVSTNTTAVTTVTTLSSSSSSLPTATTSSTTKSVSSPTPLAFTPTSVLRKMTAEKDDKDFNKLVGGDSGKLGQGRAVIGIKSQQQPPPQQSQQQQQQWGGFGLNLKQAGRPIVKANNYQPTQEQFYQQQQQQQQIFNQLAQEQLQRKMMGQQFPYNLMTTTSTTATSGTVTTHHPQYQNQFSQLTQQQLRAQHQQHARPTTTTATTQQQQSSQQFGGNWQQSNSTINQRSNQLIRNNDGGNNNDLSSSSSSSKTTATTASTTNNQLTRWFSPDLLERARIGELPSTEELAQHCLSVEDIERIAAAAPQPPPPSVHN